MPKEEKARFPATRWSLVVAAGDASNPRTQVALATLCEAYWEPLYAFLRRKGRDPDSAADLVQGFFAHFLARNDLEGVRAEKGKFRTYLLAALTHFMINERERERAAKRGGGKQHLSLDVDAAERRYLDEPAEQLTPEMAYERTWAMNQLERVLDRLRQDYAASGREAIFDGIRVYLTAAGGPAYADVVRELGMSESAIKVAVHRLRGRYRDALRAEIAETVADEAAIDEEIRYLLKVLGS